MNPAEAAEEAPSDPDTDAFYKTGRESRKHADAHGRRARVGAPRVCQGRSDQQHKCAENEWEPRVGSGLGARFNPARNNGKRGSACTTFDALHETTLQLGLRACRARARGRELVFLMLMRSRQFERRSADLLDA